MKFVDDPLTRYAPDIAAMLDYWDRVDALTGGIKALREAREKFFPKFVGEKKENYDNRLKLTKITNIWPDIVKSLQSKPFEQDAHFTTDDKEGKVHTLFDEFEEDVDGAGTNIHSFMARTFRHAINSAVDWVFVDFPNDDPNNPILTLADAKKAARRPYWSRVTARNIRQATARVIGGKEVLEYVRIFEPGKPDHVRIFQRAGDVVSWELYQKTDKEHDYKGEATAFALVGEGVLSIDEIPLVPVTTGERVGRTFEYEPSLKDAVDLQFSLYEDESGLNYIKKLTAYPMLAGQGVTPKKDASGEIIPINMGPNIALYAPMDGGGNHGEWQFIEPSAQSLTFLAGDIKEAQIQLRELGKQPLTATSGNLTVITSKIAAGKSRASVKAWAIELKNSFEHVGRITGKYLNVSPEEYRPQIFIFLDFDDTDDDTADTTTLDAARGRGDLSRETYWHELKRREILSDEFDPDIEVERLLKELPADGDDNDSTFKDDSNEE